VIFAKFPHLARFEADGLLPIAAPEKLEEVLTLFSSKLEEIGINATKDFVKGGKGDTPPGGKDEEKTSNAQSLLKLANEALASGDTATYNKNYDAYVSALQKATKPT
jgi:hypothetical protein